MALHQTGIGPWRDTSSCSSSNMLMFHLNPVIRTFLSPLTWLSTSLEPDRTAGLIYGHFSSIGTRTSSACFTVFDNVPLWYVREEEILSSLLTLWCPSTGLFFALFMVTTTILYHNTSGSTRQQHMKVLPVSLVMLLLATLVRHPSSYQHLFFNAVFS